MNASPEIEGVHTMRKTLVILDFDGTFTILEAEAAQFFGLFFELVRRRIGMSVGDFEELVREQHEYLHRFPHSHGWVHNGIIVAGLVDHHIVANVIAHRVLTLTNAIPDEEAQIKEVQSYFSAVAPQIESVFKPDAADVFQEIMARYRDTSYIVTNAETKIAQKKLNRLLGDHAPVAPLIARVQGSARKYVPDPGFDAIEPMTMSIRGLDRQIHLRRPIYYRVLDSLRRTHECTWEEMAVFGDIAELDLMMPHALGATAGLMDHKLVPEYEREYFRGHPRGHVLNTPTEILSVLDSM